MSTMKRLFQEFTVLFIGFSLTDSDTAELLSRIRSAFLGKSKRHYALMESSSIGKIRERQLLDEEMVQVVRYEATDPTHSEAVNVLERLADLQTVQQRGRMAKLILLVKAMAVLRDGSSEPRVLVSRSNPQWAEGTRVDQRAFLFPSLRDDGGSEDDVRKAVADLLGLEERDLVLTLDSKPFLSAKYNPALQEEIEYEFRFVSVRLAHRLPIFDQPVLAIGGKRFEWHGLMPLREHGPTMKMNGEVILEVSRRYGASLETVPVAVSFPGYDPYETRALHYLELPWVEDQAILSRIFPSSLRGTIPGVLDLGCGTASLGKYVCERGGQYVGIDVSPAMVQRGREALSELEGWRLERRDFALDSSPLRFDGWLFVLKNVLHLLPDLSSTLSTLRERFGDPHSLVIIETECPSLPSLCWIQSLFEAMGVTYKRHWFLDGQVATMLRILDARVLQEETVRQHIDVQEWLGSFELNDIQLDRVQHVLASAPPDVKIDMELHEDRSGRLRMIRLQRVLRVIPP